MAVTTKDTYQNKTMKMSVQVSLDGLSFCIVNTKDHTLISLEHLAFNKRLNPIEVEQRLKEFIQEQLNQYRFEDIIVIHTNELACFVPVPFFNEDYSADYLKYNNKIFSSDFIAHDVVNPYEMVNVYVPFININNLFIAQYGAFTYKHSSSILVTSLLNTQQVGEEPAMYVHVSTNYFEIVVIKNQKLVFYNTFIYETKEDFIYYVLFTIEQLNLNPETLPFYFLGTYSASDELFAIAYTYIRNVSSMLFEVKIKYDNHPRAKDRLVLLNAF